jgi:hypothetical protein
MRCAPECDHSGVFALAMLGPNPRRKISPTPFTPKTKIDETVIISEAANNLSRKAIRIPPGSGLLKAGTVLGRLCSGPFFNERDRGEPMIATPSFIYPLFVPSAAFGCDGSFGSDWATAVLLSEVDTTLCECVETTSDSGESCSYLATEPTFATAIIGPSKVRRSSLHFHATVKSEDEKQIKIAQLAHSKIEVVQ